MKTTQKHYKMTIFPKLIMLLLLVIVPLYFISLTLNRSGEESVRSEIAAATKSKISMNLRLLEQDLLRLLNLQKEFVSDTDLSDLSLLVSGELSFEDVKAVTRLQRHLDLILTSTLYADGVKAYLPNMNKAVTNERYFEEIDRSELMGMQDVQSGSHLISWNRQLYTVFHYPDSYPITRQLPAYTISVHLSNDALRQTLRQFETHGDSGAILLDNDAEWSIASGENDGLNQAMTAFASAQLTAAAGQPPAGGAATMNYRDSAYLVYYETSQKLGITLLHYIPEEQVVGPLNKYRQWFWGLTIASAVIIVLFSYWIHRIIRRPLNGLLRAFRRLETGDLQARLKWNSKDEFYDLYEQFNMTVTKLDHLIQEVYEHKFRTQQAELRHLQAQINPHFLYNSYYNLFQLAKLRDIDKVIHTAKHLGQYFQYITRDADAVSLETELRFAQAYIEIQSVRFENRIAVQIDELLPLFAQLQVPKLIIQPVIENSYKYGLEDKKEGGRLTVKFVQQEHAVLIMIEDNGEAADEDLIHKLNNQFKETNFVLHNSSGTGLNNVHRRLRLQFGGEGGLSVYPSRLGGLGVRIQIPILFKSEGDTNASTVDR
ncbi:sensor histidine kinase [Paenibacillus sp. GCM10027626]|uniref:sensor histidine kinase n=1 Tax=Paenibacillus sp. GCM10027626 TaxID=3273411 RepID=UPI00363987EB